MLTRRGWGVVATATALYGAGVALGYVELVVLAAGAWLAVVVGFAWMLRRPALDVHRRIQPDRVVRGDPAAGAITFSNPGRLASSAATAVERYGGGRVTIEVPRLAPGASTSSTYPLPTDRRMAVDVGPVEVTREDPLALWRTVRTAGDVRRLWVHPVAHPLLALPSGRTRSLEGDARDHVPHGSVTFHALRDYEPGDDLRLVHWRSFARTGTLMVRENVDASVPRITVLVDDRAAVHDDDGFEEAMDLAASVVVAGTVSGYPVRMVTAGGRAVGGRGRPGDAPEFLDALSELRPVDVTDLRPLVARLALEGRSDTLVVVSGVPGPDDLSAVGALARRYDDALVALVGDEVERALVPAGMAAVVLRATTAGEAVQRWNRRLA